MGPNYGLDKGFIIDTGNAVAYGLFVILGSDNKHVALAGAGALAIGVAQETLDATKIATAKATVEVRIQGMTRAVAGVNNITRGARLVTDSSGRAVLASASVGQQNVVGVAFSPSASVGDWIDVLLTPGLSHNTAVS
jgi:Uncharacterized conserved protein (DUF2190)